MGQAMMEQTQHVETDSAHEAVHQWADLIPGGWATILVILGVGAFAVIKKKLKGS